MLDKNKIILMTAISEYEEKEGKDDLAINGYFRGDYIGFEYDVRELEEKRKE